VLCHAGWLRGRRLLERERFADSTVVELAASGGFDAADNWHAAR
jgi:hypothetical protein